MSRLLFESQPGLATLSRRMNSARERLAETGRLHQRAGQRVGEWIAMNFESGGRLGQGAAGGWPRLRESTLAKRRRRGRGRAMLVDSGRLKRGTQIKAGRNRVRVSNSVPYAAAHQFGLGVPRRPFFPTRGEAGRLIHPIAERFVEEALR